MTALTEAPAFDRLSPVDAAAGPGDGSERSVSERVPPLLLALAAVVVATGVVLRFSSLSSSIWFDEAQTVLDVNGSLGHVIHTVVHQEANPPVYFVLLWLWRQLLGPSIVAMRLLSALTGTAMVPLAYLAVRRRFGLRAGVAAAALVAASPTLVYYSSELRMYSLLMVECGLGLIAFSSARSSGSPRALAAFSVVSALCLWTQYWAALIVVPEAVLVLAGAWAKPERRAGIAAVAAVAVAALPLPLLMLYQNARAFTYGSTLVSMPWQHPSAGFIHSFTHSFGLTELDLAKQLLVNLGGPDESRLTWVLLLLVAVALVLLVRDTEHPRRRLAIRMLTLMAPALVVAELMLHTGLPVQGRYLLVVWLPAATVVAYATTSRSAGVVGLTLLTGLCGIWLAIGIISDVVPSLATRDDTVGAARALGVAQSQRLIAIDETWDLFPLRIYRPQARLDHTKIVRVREVDVIRMPVGGEPAPAYHGFADLTPVPALPAGFRRVSIVRGPTFDVERFVSRVPARVRVAGAGTTFPAGWRFLIEASGGRLAT